MNGKVKFFDQKKGFGFIVEDGTNNEYFFHITECLDKIENDDLVSYEVTNGKKGLSATQVSLLKS